MQFFIGNSGRRCRVVLLTTRNKINRQRKCTDPRRSSSVRRGSAPHTQRYNILFYLCAGNGINVNIASLRANMAAIHLFTFASAGVQCLPRGRDDKIRQTRRRAKRHAAMGGRKREKKNCERRPHCSTKGENIDIAADVRA